MGNRRTILGCSVSLVLWLLQPKTIAMAGQVVVDNTFGHASSLSGPKFGIAASFGRRLGPNLFQSFRTLNLDRGDVATFSGPTSVRNVFARVTGGVSQIDGTLRCTIPDADLYLIDPMGVIFGSHASLDVHGSFAVTTASYIGFSSGTFSATAKAPFLSIAAPDAFGFLTPSQSPGAITLAGTSAAPLSLAVNRGKAIRFVGGDIRIENASIAAPSSAKSGAAAGAIDLVAVGGKGAASIRAGSINLASGVARADISIVHATINASGTGNVGGGTVLLEGNNLALSSATVLSQTVNGVGSGIFVHTTGPLGLSATTLDTSSSNFGQAGDIQIDARHAVLHNVTTLSQATGSILGQANMSLSLNMTQVMDDKITVSLKSPDGTVFTPFSNLENGAGNVGFHKTTISDNAPVQISTPGVPGEGSQFSGNFLPAFGASSFFQNFHNQIADGKWTLAITNAGSLSGVLDNWTLKFGSATFHQSTPVTLLPGQMAASILDVTTSKTLRVASNPLPQGGAISFESPTANAYGSVLFSADALTGGKEGKITFDHNLNQSSNGIPNSLKDGQPGGFQVDAQQQGRFFAADRIIADGSLPANSGIATLSLSDGKNITYRGEQIGQNVFFSFKELDLGSGDAVTFGTSGNVPAKFIFVRVTGASPSNIDGAVQCSIPGANVYLINPAGIVFGGSGGLDASDANGDFSFFGTTANYAVLAGGSQFGTVPSATLDAHLSGHTPVSLAFTQPHPAAISILMDPSSGELIDTAFGENISLVSGGISIDGASATSDIVGADRINLVSVASAGVVRLESGFLAPAPQLRGFTSLGKVVITDQAQVVGGSSAAFDPSGELPATIIDCGALKVLNGGEIFSGNTPDASGNVPDGALVINAKSIDIDSRGVNLTPTGILAYAFALPTSPANAAKSAPSSIVINTNSLYVSGGEIATKKVGGVVVPTGPISITDHGPLTLTNFSIVSAAAGSSLGNISVKADSLTLENGGQFQDESFSTTGGKIYLDILRDTLISNCDNGALLATAPDGKGGDISLTDKEGSITIQNSSIDASAEKEGVVTLSAAKGIRISDSTISAQATKGNGGTITLNASDGGFVTLSNSTLNGLSRKKPVVVRVQTAADRYVQSSDTHILSDAVFVPVQVDIAASLVNLPANVQLPEARLQESCPHLLIGPDVSNFTLGGQGSEPLEPGGWVPDISVDSPGNDHHLKDR